MGVEPTKDRLAALPGFEVRTPHRGRCSSRRYHCDVCFIRAAAEQIEAVFIDTTQIAAAKCDTVAIEELENLD